MSMVNPWTCLSWVTVEPEVLYSTVHYSTEIWDPNAPSRHRVRDTPVHVTVVHGVLPFRVHNKLGIPCPLSCRYWSEESLSPQSRRVWDPLIRLRFLRHIISSNRTSRSTESSRRRDKYIVHPIIKSSRDSTHRRVESVPWLRSPLLYGEVKSGPLILDKTHPVRGEGTYVPWWSRIHDTTYWWDHQFLGKEPYVPWRSWTRVPFTLTRLTGFMTKGSSVP